MPPLGPLKMGDGRGRAAEKAENQNADFVHKAVTFYVGGLCPQVVYMRTRSLHY